jgi:hypothetical protein
MPASLDALAAAPDGGRDADVVAALALAASAVGRGGRVSLFLGSVPVSFARVNAEAESAALRGPNFSDHLRAIVALLEQHDAIFDVFVNSLCARLIDCASFARVVAATGGALAYVNPSQHFCLEARIASHLRTSDVKCSLAVSQGELLPSLGAFAHSPRGFRASAAGCTVWPVRLPAQLDGPLIAQAHLACRGWDGSACVRVITRAFESTDDIAALFENADCHALLAWLANSTISSFFAQTMQLVQAKAVFINLLRPIFEAYRFHVSRSANRLAALVLPASLELLPRLALGILKSTVFTPGISIDERACQIFAISAMDPAALGAVAYPVMFDLARVLAEGRSPVPLPLFERELLPPRILVLFDGFGSYLWLGGSVDRGICMKLFNRPSTYAVERLEPLDTEESRKMYAMLKGNVRLFVGGGKGLTLLFQDRLVEETGTVQCSYAAWIAQLNRISIPANTSHSKTDSGGWM